VVSGGSGGAFASLRILLDGLLGDWFLERLFPGHYDLLPLRSNR
jgi:hypothetical protein